MPRSLWFLLFITGAGLAFSGYLSAVKLFSNSCAFGETCPYFLGYPACWYGFGMYLAMFTAVSLALLGKGSPAAAHEWTAGIALAGTIFAGSLVIQEMLAGTARGPLGLSTCAYGLLGYLVIVGISFAALRREARETPAL